MIDSEALGFHYLMSGLHVASSVALPMRTAIDAPPGAVVDATIEQAPVPDRLEQPTHHGSVWAADATRFLLVLPDIGRFMAAGGRRVTVQPAPGVPVADILPFVTGTMLAALLYQRGGFILHASAVTRNGRAFVFCGPSGTGKSTLASALCRAECGFLSDDLCVIDTGGGRPPIVRPDGRALRLYPDSIARMGLNDAAGPRVRIAVDKYHVTPPGEPAAPAEAPLAGVYMLADANAAAPAGITGLPPVAAAQALLRQSYRRRLALAYCGVGQLATRTAAIVTHAPVHFLHRPRDLTRIDETVAMLLAAWRGADD